MPHQENVKTKDPDAVLDYKFDWAGLTNGEEGAISDWLDEDETIATYTLTPDDGLVVDSHDLTDNDTSVTYWLSGGTAGQSYRVVNHIVTSAGREEDRTMIIEVRER